VAEARAEKRRIIDAFKESLSGLQAIELAEDDLLGDRHEG
jgi:hypothetical protein